jgi:hypothetical protein
VKRKRDASRQSRILLRIFLSKKFTEAEEIAFKLRRGEVGMLSSVTNKGKSTLIRNACLTLAAGGSFGDLVKKTKARKTLLLDFETSASRMQQDLRTQTRDLTPDELELIEKNLFIACDVLVKDELLNLSRDEHLKLVERALEERNIDFLVIDTQAAAFDLFDENNNAEVSRKISKPLLRLARKFNCAILIAHHIGKQKSEEGQIKEKVYAPRGASSFGCNVAAAFNLTADPNDPTLVTLSGAKAKDGQEYERVLRLNRESRWFVFQDNPAEPQLSPLELLISAIKADGREILKTHEIKELLKEKLSERSIEKLIAEAEKLGKLFKVRKGVWGTSQTSAASAFPIGRADAADHQEENEWVKKEV